MAYKMVTLQIIFLNVPLCMAMRCYRCSSREYPTVCGSDFKLTPNNTSHIIENCDTCHKFVSKKTREITRNCTLSRSYSFQISFGCKKETINGQEIEHCSCNKPELCNNTQRLISGETVFLLMLSVVFLFGQSC